MLYSALDEHAGGCTAIKQHPLTNVSQSGTFTDLVYGLDKLPRLGGCLLDSNHIVDRIRLVYQADMVISSSSVLMSIELLRCESQTPFSRSVEGHPRPLNVP